MLLSQRTRPEHSPNTISRPTHMCMYIQKSQLDLFIFDRCWINLLFFHIVIDISRIFLKNVVDKEPRVKVIKVKKMN